MTPPSSPTPASRWLRPAEPPLRDNGELFRGSAVSAPLTDGAGESTSNAAGQAGGERQPHFDSTFGSFTTPGEQSGLAVTVSPDSGSGGRMSFLRLRDTPTGLAIDFVDVPTVDVTAGHVDFRETVIATSLDRTVPHTVRISMDFVPGANNDVVAVYVDDQLRMTGSSWENYYRLDTENGPANPVPVVDQLLLRVSSAAQPALAGKGFLIDDVSARSYGGPGRCQRHHPRRGHRHAREHPLLALEPAHGHGLGPPALPGQGGHLQRHRLAREPRRCGRPAHVRPVLTRVHDDADPVRDG